MDPIISPTLVDYGIAIVFTNLDSSYNNSLINLQILYTQNNPLFNWLNCSNNVTTLWNQTTTVDPNGTIFLYQSDSNLNIGFYAIKASLFTSAQPKIGELIIGVYTPIPNLTIGCPYSMYPPISLF